MRKLDVLTDGLIFPEGPRWRDGRLWVSDMHDHKVLAVDMDGTKTVIAEVVTQPSGLGWTPDGALLIVSMLDRRLLRLDGNGLSEIADLSSLAPCHCNDMVVDRHGRAYVGNFGFDLHQEGFEITPTVLILVSPDGSVKQVADDLYFPNGTVITPDGKTLIIGESFGGRLTAFDIAADGSLSNRRVWAQLDGVAPDGITLDMEGAIWVANPLGRDVIRVGEGGRIFERIPVETNAFACMLGGPEGRTLFVATAPESNPHILNGHRGGRIEVTTVDIPHAGWP